MVGERQVSEQIKKKTPHTKHQNKGKDLSKLLSSLSCVKCVWALKVMLFSWIRSKMIQPKNTSCTFVSPVWLLCAFMDFTPSRANYLTLLLSQCDFFKMYCPTKGRNILPPWVDPRGNKNKNGKLSSGRSPAHNFWLWQAAGKEIPLEGRWPSLGETIGIWSVSREAKLRPVPCYARKNKKAFCVGRTRVNSVI